jgi:hypothetical protein
MAITETAQQVFHMLERAAELGDECPSNSVIAATIDCSSLSMGPRILNQLTKAGLITVQRGNASRIVTIAATGKCTAGIVTKPHWRDRPENAWRRNLKIGKNPHPVKVKLKKGDGPNTVRVDRDPCPNCGVRKDIGCAHFGLVDNNSVRRNVAFARFAAGA